MNATEGGSPPCPLTPREVRLLQGLARGLTNAEIGRACARSDKTIRNQLSQLYAKLGARNRAEAVALFLQQSEGRTQLQDIRPVDGAE